jgi:AraC-like DNA-binding protein
MPRSHPESDPFDFDEYLSDEEKRVVASPHHWKWIASCFPQQVAPLTRHRHLKWLLDPEHCHTPPQRELFFALSGSTVASFNHKVYPTKPGTIMLFDHYESHGGLELPPFVRSCRFFWIHLPTRNQMSTNIFSVDAAGIPNDLSLKVRSDNFVHLLYDAWTNCVSNPHSVLNRTLLQSVLTTAFLESLGRPSRQPAAEVERSVVGYIETYINTHLSEPLTLNHLARLAGYNPFSFHRLFKKHQKITLHRFIMERRLTQARKLLLQGLSVESVAEAVGLSSSAVFSRFFKTQAELSPSSWRKLNRYEIT